jgi:hypothetical protein
MTLQVLVRLKEVLEGSGSSSHVELKDVYESTRYVGTMHGCFL